MVSTIMLELAEELVDPSEAILDDQIQEVIDNEEEVMLGISDEDDEIIDFIDKGERISNSDPIDFTDDEVQDIIYDDMEDDL